MPGLRLILEAELPDVQDALRAPARAGFDLLDPLPPFFADRRRVRSTTSSGRYTARRPAGEWVLARRRPQASRG